MKTLNSFLIFIIAGIGLYVALDGSAPATTDDFSKFHTLDTVTVDTSKGWERPRFEQRRNERHDMVEEGIKKQGINDSKVLNAIREVPRHFFVPENYQQYAYENRPLPIGHDQTISQPFIVAYMTNMLDLDSEDKVLEIGTGSGYQAAVLSELTPHVYTIEIVKPLGDQAIKRFDILGYHTIEAKIGNGYKGWPEHEPFDAIILTAAPEEIPEPLIEQLAPGGTLVAPVGSVDANQVLTKITKNEDGELQREKRIPVRFVPMTGESQNGQ